MIGIDQKIVHGNSEDTMKVILLTIKGSTTPVVWETKRKKRPRVRPKKRWMYGMRDGTLRGYWPGGMDLRVKRPENKYCLFSDEKNQTV